MSQEDERNRVRRYSKLVTEIVEFSRFFISTVFGGKQVTNYYIKLFIWIFYICRFNKYRIVQRNDCPTLIIVTYISNS